MHRGLTGRCLIISHGKPTFWPASASGTTRQVLWFRVIAIIRTKAMPVLPCGRSWQVDVRGLQVRENRVRRFLEDA
jgi:hypothetical protein